MNNNEYLKDLLLFFAELYKEPNQQLYELISSDSFELDFNTVLQQLQVPLQLTILSKPNSFEEMKKEYQQLFLQNYKHSATLCESYYKIWTSDPTASLPFANSKQLFMGDSAWHIRYLLEQLNIELGDHVKTMPDHLSIILELAVVLLPNKDQLNTFINSHLDWLDDLLTEMKQIKRSSFYGNMIEMLHFIIQYFVNNFDKISLEGSTCLSQFQEEHF